MNEASTRNYQILREYGAPWIRMDESTLRTLIDVVNVLKEGFDRLLQNPVDNRNQEGVTYQSVGKNPDLIADDDLLYMIAVLRKATGIFDGELRAVWLEYMKTASDLEIAEEKAKRQKQA